MGTKACSTCPTTYAELYEQWHDKLATTIRGFDYPEEEVEDVMQELLTRFMEGNYLAVYQRDWVDPVTHKPKGAFSTFMYTFVKTRLLGWRDRRIRKMYREPFLVTDSVNSEGETFQLEMVDGSAQQSLEEVESSADIDIVLANLRRMGRKGRDHAATIACMRKQLLTGDRKINMVKLAKKRHTSVPKLKSSFAEMQQTLVIQDWRNEAYR